jgi:hypothetical protein
MTARAALKRFDTEQDLTDYADQLNEAGMSPEIAVMDSSGISALATLQAPGGDGWAFAYYGVNDGDNGTIVGEVDGGWVKPARHVDEYGKGHGWEPTWPVFGIVAALT